MKFLDLAESVYQIVSKLVDLGAKLLSILSIIGTFGLCLFGILQNKNLEFFVIFPIFNYLLVFKTDFCVNKKLKYLFYFSLLLPCLYFTYYFGFGLIGNAKSGSLTDSQNFISNIFFSLIIPSQLYVSIINALYIFRKSSNSKTESGSR